MRESNKSNFSQLLSKLLEEWFKFFPIFVFLSSLKEKTFFCLEPNENMEIDFRIKMLAWLLKFTCQDLDEPIRFASPSFSLNIYISVHWYSCEFIHSSINCWYFFRVAFYRIHDWKSPTMMLQKPINYSWLYWRGQKRQRPSYQIRSRVTNEGKNAQGPNGKHMKRDCPSE